jgi:hypothetical protein
MNWFNPGDRIVTSSASFTRLPAKVDVIKIVIWPCLLDSVPGHLV